ncbi:single-stranded DNA-binding protein [bacterium]|nr:single-stranded DNA-binding protein [bacterium]
MINRQEIEGNLGNAPEIKTTPTGKTVASFRLAHNKQFKDKDGEKQTKALWFTVEAWDELAKYCERDLKKGSWVYVSGRSEMDQWEDKKGAKHETHKLIASEISKIEKKNETAKDTHE